MSSNDVFDPGNVPSVIAATNEAGFIGAVRAAASLAGKSFNDDSSPEELLFAIRRKRDPSRGKEQLTVGPRPETRHSCSGSRGERCYSRQVCGQFPATPQRLCHKQCSRDAVGFLDSSAGTRYQRTKRVQRGVAGLLQLSGLLRPAPRITAASCSSASGRVEREGPRRRSASAR